MDVTYFEPSLSRAQSCRKAMDDALWSSVDAVLAERLGDNASAVAETSAGRPSAGPLDYGAYFDLVLSLPGMDDLPEETKDEAIAHLLARLSEPAEPLAKAAKTQGGTPRVTNLAPDCYSPEQIERFRRWWDIEPQNAMGMTGLAEPDMQFARLLFDTALECLRQVAPEMHAEVLAIASDVIMTRPDREGRFNYGGATSFSLWGAFAINAQSHCSWPRYYRTIVHETGHNLLFAMAREAPLVADLPDERHASPLRADPRPMDGIFHAGFVSARESLAFDKLLCRHDETGCLDTEDVEELNGLLNESVIAFWDCARILRDEAQLTPLGEAILEECEAYMDANFRVESA